MAGIFQRLIELGEEPKVESQQLTRSSSVTGNSASKEELLAQNSQLHSIIADQKHKYESLMGDSTKLRSEYDAFRQRATGERRQLTQQLAEDKRLLEELRRAGSTGQVDETYVKEMDAKLLELQQQVKRAQDDAQKAFQKQREAEHARAAAEAAGKEEIQELYQKAESFQAVMRQHSGGPPEPPANGEGGPAASPDASFAESSPDRAELRRQLAAARWECLAASKKAAELRAEAEAWRARAAQHAAALESAAEERAESLSNSASSALHEQREHFERLLRETEEARRAQQQLARSLEAALQDAQAERRELADVMDGMRRELEQSRRAVSELDTMQAQSQQLMAMREREVCVREQEIQTLRARLREEETAHHNARWRVAELEAERRGAEEKENEVERGEEEGKKEEKVKEETDRGTITGQPGIREEAMRQLQARLDDLIAQSARFACYREEQAARTRQLESRIHELEADAGSPKTTALEMLYAAPSERTRQQFVAEATTTARKMRLAAVTSKRRLLIGFFVSLIIIIMFINFLAAPNVERAESGAEAVLHRYSLLQRQYSKLLEELKRCSDRIGGAGPI